MTRVRYFKVSDGVFKSKEILINNDAVVVTLTSVPEGLSYSIVSVGTSVVLEQGLSKSTHVVKKKVKRALSSMGKLFNDEIRRKKEHQLNG